MLTKERMYSGEILWRPEGVRFQSTGQEWGGEYSCGLEAGEGSSEEAQEDRGETWPSGLLKLPGMMAWGVVVSRTQSGVQKS